VLARENLTGSARLGLAISKRAAKRAVDRNRLKRIAREVFRKQLDLPPLDFVVMAGAKAKDADLAALRGSLELHFARLAERTRRGSRG